MFLKTKLGEMKDDYITTKQELEVVKEAMDEIISLLGRLFSITDFSDTKPVLELLGKSE